MDIKEYSKNIYNLSEDLIYEILEMFERNQNIDRTLTYVFIKIYYIHSIRLYLSSRCKIDIFDDIYMEYRNNILECYKINNAQISEELLNDISKFSDTILEMLESMNFKEINDSYEFRHYTILCFELLRKILENKSKNTIRGDMFDNYISKLKEKADEIIAFTAKMLK